jgi:hypothetical protein
MFHANIAINADQAYQYIKVKKNRLNQIYDVNILELSIEFFA